MLLLLVSFRKRDKTLLDITARTALWLSASLEVENRSPLAVTAQKCGPKSALRNKFFYRVEPEVRRAFDFRLGAPHVKKTA